jgi:hypothetical protein
MAAIQRWRSTTKHSDHPQAPTRRASAIPPARFCCRGPRWAEARPPVPSAEAAATGRVGVLDRRRVRTSRALPACQRRPRARPVRVARSTVRKLGPREAGRPGRLPDAGEPESQDTCPPCRRRPADHPPTPAPRDGTDGTTAPPGLPARAVAPSHRHAITPSRSHAVTQSRSHAVTPPARHRHGETEGAAAGHAHAAIARPAPSPNARTRIAHPGRLPDTRPPPHQDTEPPAAVPLTTSTPTPGAGTG